MEINIVVKDQKKEGKGGKNAREIRRKEERGVRRRNRIRKKQKDKIKGGKR
jgi:hypothetical protein